MRAAIVVAIALSLAAAACNDSTGPDGDRLSRAESLQLAAQVLASGEGAATASMSMAGPMTDMPEGGGPPTSFTLVQETTHPCAGAGQVVMQFVLSGTFDDDTNAMQADLEGTQVHNSCAFPHGGLTLTVDGEPAVGFTASVGAVDGMPSQPFTFSLDGALRWESSDGRSGVCALTLDAVTDFAAQQRTVQGAVCGHTIDQTLSWS